MIENVTLLRVDPPPPAPAGPALSARCALAPPTAGELQWLAMAGLSADAVLYARPAADGGPAVAAGDVVRVRLDGRPDDAAWAVVHVAHRAGDVLRYTQVFLAAGSGGIAE